MVFTKVLIHKFLKDSIIVLGFLSGSRFREPQSKRKSFSTRQNVIFCFFDFLSTFATVSVLFKMDIVNIYIVFF